MDTLNLQDQCVGFSDCPCRKCRRRRVEASQPAAHAAHVEAGAFEPYCGGCTTHARHAANGERHLECTVCARL